MLSNLNTNTNVDVYDENNKLLSKEANTKNIKTDKEIEVTPSGSWLKSDNLGNTVYVDWHDGIKYGYAIIDHSIKDSIPAKLVRNEINYNRFVESGQVYKTSNIKTPIEAEVQFNTPFPFTPLVIHVIDRLEFENNVSPQFHFAFTGANEKGFNYILETNASTATVRWYTTTLPNPWTIHPSNLTHNNIKIKK